MNKPIYKPGNNLQDDLIIYPEYDARILRNHDYTVTVSRGGSSCRLPVYDHATAEANGRMSCGADLHRRFCEFAFTGKGQDKSGSGGSNSGSRSDNNRGSNSGSGSGNNENSYNGSGGSGGSENDVSGNDGQVRIDIEACSDPFSETGAEIVSYAILPKHMHIRSEIKGRVITVWLDKPVYFMLRLNDDENTLLRVFADRPEDKALIPCKGDASVLYVKGWHEPENAQVILNDSLKTIYLAPGSVLCARVRVEGEGCRILGRGIILDPYSNIFKYDLRNKVQKHFFEVVSRNLTVRDVKLVDGRGFNITMGTDITGGGDCGGCTYENVKVLSSVICTDGFSFWGVDHITVRGCFIECGDNALVISLGSSDILVADTYIGTLCKAIVPTYNVGDNVHLEDIYVFRASEGLFSHFTSRKQFTVTHGFSMSVANLDAADCIDFPWIFSGYNTGTYDKYITFRNVSVPESSGTSVVEAAEKSRCAIKIFNSPQYAYTENYHITFENLFVGGKPVAEEGQIVTDIDRNNELVFKLDRTSMPDFTGVQDEYGLPGGSSAGNDKAAGSCSSLHFKGSLPSDNLSGYNLVCEKYRHKSVWQETTAYRVDLSIATDSAEKGATYHLSIYGSGRQPGMNCQIGHELKRLGQGVYSLGFETKLSGTTGKQYAEEFTASVVGRCSKKILAQPFSVSAEWTRKSMDFDLSGWDFASHKIIELNISKDSENDADILIREVKMLKNSHPDT